MKKIIVVLDCLAILIAAFASEYAMRALLDHYYSQIEYSYSDAPLMIVGLLIGFVYRPLIAFAISLFFVLITWFILKKLNRNIIKIKWLIVGTISVPLTSLLVSALWAFIEYSTETLWP